MPGTSAFVRCGRSKMQEIELRIKRIPMFQIRTKVDELFEVLKAAEADGDIRLEEFSVAYEFLPNVKTPSNCSSYSV